MRTTGRATRTAVSLLLLSMLAGACAGGDAGAGGAAGASPAGSPPLATPGEAPSVTPVPTPDPTARPSASAAYLTSDVLEANRTPWPVAAISAGMSICAIGTDGRLRCWAGADTPPEGEFTSVSVGGAATCGIRTDGTVTCWGESRLPSPKGTFTAVAAGEARACGIRASGTIHCWWMGETDEGEPKAGSDDPDLPEGTYVALSLVPDAGGCALRDDGTISCWGEDDEGNRPAPEGTFISLGDSCGVLESGEIGCFGTTTWDGGGPRPSLPAGPFVAMDGSRFHGCAVRATGSVTCWGSTGWDEGEGGIPLQTPPGTWTAVTVGGDHACAIAPDRHAVCWGTRTDTARPAPRVVVESWPFTTTEEVGARWTGFPVAAPIEGYDVEYRTGSAYAEEEPARPWTRLVTGTTQSSASMTGAEGESYCWRVRAHDADGIASDWDESYQCTAVPIDARSLASTGPWKRVEGTGFFRGSALRTTTRGATLLIAAEGAFGLVILASTCGGCGTVVLRYPETECWDDEDEEADGASPTPRPTCPPGEETINLKGALEESAMVFMGNNGQEGYAGPLELVVTSSGKLVTIDAVIFADTE